MTDRGEWIVVRNWDKFQHYTDRDPIWIKVYTELNRRDDWRSLTFSERGVMVSIWTEYGVADGLLRVSDLGSRLGQRVDSRALVSLSDAGYISIVASKPLALARSREKEKRREEQTGSPVRKPKPVDNSDPGRSNVLPKDPVAAVERMIRNRVITDVVELTAEIAGYHLDESTANRLRGMLQ
jgi:hypothetical protein